MRSSVPVLVYCGTNRVTRSLIRDAEHWEDFSEETMHSYVRDGAEMLVTSLKAFVDPERPYNSLQAKELRFMLEALIEVKEVFMNDSLPVVRREG
jgi:hypothetical protein